MVKKKKATSVRNEVPVKEDLKKFKEEIVHEFHVISEALINQINGPQKVALFFSCSIFSWSHKDIS
jgi:hypothetical protein